MVAIFRKDERGHRPVSGAANKVNNGTGIGASHQTGWTRLVARLVDILAEMRPEHLLRARGGDAFEIGGATQLSEDEVYHVAELGSEL
jgi:hypothetical protein